jgi:hypothetical protein
MEYWAHNFDWSRLRRVCLHDYSIPFARHLAPRLTRLEELELRYSRNNCLALHLPFLLTTIPSTLTSLSTPRLSPLDIPALAPHAATLRNLSVHSSSPRDIKPRELALQPDELALLRDVLPHLETLTLVCPCPDPDPDPDPDTEPATAPPSSPYHTTLAQLSAFPRLRSLTLWFDLGRPEPPHTSYLTATSVADMFRLLRRQHRRRHRRRHRTPSGASGACLLRRLQVHSGLPCQPPGACLSCGFGPEWRWENTTEFVVEARQGPVCKNTTVVGVEGDEDDEKEEEVEVRCLKLDRAQNETLRRVAGGEVEMT